LRRNTAWQAVHSGSLAPAEKRQMDDNSLKFLEIGTGAERRALAIRAREGALPGLLWLSGYKSDMKGTKAAALAHWAAQAGRAAARSRHCR